MKTNNFSGIISFWIFCCCGLQFCAADPGGSLRANPSEIDLGEFFQHREMRVLFELQNNGATPVQIQRVRTGCGCAATIDCPEELHPGGRGNLEIRLRPYSLNGDFLHLIFVETASVPRQILRLPVKGRAVAAVEVQPGRVHKLDPVHAGETWSQEFTLKAKERISLEAPILETNYPMKSEFAQVPEEPGAYTFKLEFTPDFAAGDLHCTAGFRSPSLYNERVLEIIVTAPVRGNLSVEPASFTLPRIATAPVRIPFEIHIAESAMKDFDVAALNYGASFGGIKVEFGKLRNRTVAATAEIVAEALPGLAGQFEPAIIIRAGNLQPVLVQLRFQEE